MDELAKMPRRRGTARDLILGLECGGSDTFSGMTANPAVGKAVDRLVEMGGTAILSETTEMIGALDPLLRRAENDDVASRLKEMVEHQGAHAADAGTPGSPGPGARQRRIGALHDSREEPRLHRQGRRL